jgi:uncharacterized protein YacL
MKKTLSITRLIFFALCLAGSGIIWYTNPGLQKNAFIIFGLGITLGLLTILADLALKEFSVKKLIILSFGLGVGAFIAFLIGSSPLFDISNPEIKHYGQIALYVACMYLATMVALRNKNDLNLLIPYIRFVPQNNETPLIIVDSSALIDGRIAPICQSRFITSTLVVPKFVLEELHKIAESEDGQRQLKGRKGIEALNKLKNMTYIDLRIQDIEIDSAQHTDSKLIFLAQNLKGKLLTTDHNLAKLAEFHGIEWLNIGALTKALNPDVSVGQYFDVDLVKLGKEPHQGVGYLADGSMVVVNEAVNYIGQAVAAEVISVLPSAGGKMIFARLHSKPAEMSA